MSVREREREQGMACNKGLQQDLKQGCYGYFVNHNDAHDIDLKIDSLHHLM